MRLRSADLLLLLALATGCAATPAAIEPPGATAPPAATTGPMSVETRPLEADTPVRMAGGATFTAPKGWFVTHRGSLAVLEEPERTLTVTFVEVQERVAQAAIGAAWAQVRPGSVRRVRRTSQPPPGAWDEMLRVEYETTTAEARSVVAIARRKGATWYVALLDGPRASFDRRAAGVNSAFTSLRAPGLRPESWRGRVAHGLDETRAAQLEAFVEHARRRAMVPGAAVAVVQHGAVAYAKGFGVRALGRPDSVTADTLFMVGSITKSLTSLMMAVLVDQNRFTWETPVTQLWPPFALGDAEATRRLTVKHTVCACTGLPRQDMEFFFGYSRATPESRIGEMKQMVPTTGFGETFQYSNGMVSAGGYIAARASRPDLGMGPAFDAAMGELVFGPLGMNRTTFDFTAVEGGDHALPHALTVDSEYVPLPMATEWWIPPIRPAGGAWSTARDMARYLMVELGAGALPDGRPVVSRANLLKRRESQVKIDAWSSYGLALEIGNIRGVTVIGHAGATSGFSALMFFLPDHDLGGVILTNAGGASAFATAVRGRLLEVLFDGREEAADRLAFAMQQRVETRRLERARVEMQPDVAVLRPFVGTYQNASLGRVRLRLEGPRAVLDAGDWRSALGRRMEADGTNKLILLDPPWAYFELIAEEADGRPRLILERPQHRYVFKAVP